LFWSHFLGIISFKSFRQHFPFTFSLYEALVGRVARRAYLSVILLLILLTTAIRIRSFLLVRRFQQVLSGLSKIQIDKTTEEDLLRLVPSLVRTVAEEKSGAQLGRYYYVVSSNGTDRLMHQLYFRDLGYRFPRSHVLEIADWLGYRYIDFYAQLLVIDGNVSRIRYEIANEYTIPNGLSDYISVRSVHGVWDREAKTVVTPAEDENPQFRVSGDERSLDVTYTFDATPEEVSHAFNINLSCFWSFIGCRTARDIAPHLWQYKDEIQEKAFSRLGSNEPCPNRVLADRVKYLPDLDVLLLDVVSVSKEASGEAGKKSGISMFGYQLREIVRGSQGDSASAKKFRYYPEIRASSNLRSLSANPLSRAPQIRDRDLLFTGVLFESCQIIPEIPSTLAVVQKAVPIPRRQEDENLGKSRM
jgi:hypothetical protein